MLNRISIFITVLTVITLFSTASAQIKREREESPPGIEASNTMGFGNVWMRGNLLFNYRENSGARIEPHAAAGLGLANNLAVWGGAVIFEGSYKKLIGKADAHVKVTLPGNDNFRFFGFGVQGDLILSSDKDTLSSTTDTNRPSYSPIIGFTAMADFEIIKIVKTLPLKAYINFSTIDDDRLLTEWKQQSYRFALEWKGERNCFYAGSRYGRYTEKHAKTGATPADASAITSFGGLRFRPIDRLAIMITGLFSIPLSDGPDFVRYGLTTSLEMPIFFRETNTEAIRTLVMMENSKPQTVTRSSTRLKSTHTVESLFLSDIDAPPPTETASDSTDIDIDDKDRQLQERRKNIDNELKGIEILLE
ncbi:MAG: hypothetical protein JNL74_21380 [Fibrobacteres bacterium]|nr:hypothetical protein [Fibrobacterota bacterium]